MDEFYGGIRTDGGNLMLLNEFDENRNAVINPDMVQKKMEDFPDTIVSAVLKMCLHWAGNALFYWETVVC